MIEFFSSLKNSKVLLRKMSCVSKNVAKSHFYVWKNVEVWCFYVWKNVYYN